MTTKYPLQVAVEKQRQTFSIDSYLFAASAENGESPKTLFGKFSRYVLTIISEEKIAASGNIDPLTFSVIDKKSKACFEKDLFMTGSSDNNTSPAYTEKFRSGNVKGKTPAQVLLENPEKGADILNSQYAWLQQNLQKYPSNQNLMDAIKDAARLKKEGGLENKGNNSIVILPKEMRPNQYKPQVRQTPSGNINMCPVYEVGITWSFGDKYPVIVEIENYFAPVRKNEQGLLNVLKTQMDQNGYKKNTMRLTGEAWLKMLKLVEYDMDRFNMLNAKAIEVSADNAYQNARKNVS